LKVTFKDILDRAYTTLFTDYKLDKLVEIDEQAFYTYLGGFLANATDYFDGCLSDLSYHPITETIEKDNQLVEVKNYVFDNDLSSKEQYILSLGVALGWYKKQLDDVTQFKLHLSNKDFKSYSEQQNLQRRLERLGAMEEELSEEIIKYQLNNIDKLPYFGGG
jgi:hypothetical protein